MSTNDYAKLLKSFKKVLKAMGTIREQLEQVQDRCEETDCTHCDCAVNMADDIVKLCDDMDNALMDYPDYGF